MHVFLSFLAIFGGGFLLLGAVVALIAWSAGRWDRMDNAASGFQRHEPYVDPAAPYTATTERDESFLAGDFEQAGFDRLRADIAKARAEASDPTSPARLRHIPAQRKEQP